MENLFLERLSQWGEEHNNLIDKTLQAGGYDNASDFINHTLSGLIAGMIEQTHCDDNGKMAFYFLSGGDDIAIAEMTTTALMYGEDYMRLKIILKQLIETYQMDVLPKYIIDAYTVSCLKTYDGNYREVWAKFFLSRGYQVAAPLELDGDGTAPFMPVYIFETLDETPDKLSPICKITKLDWDANNPQYTVTINASGSSTIETLEYDGEIISDASGEKNYNKVIKYYEGDEQTPIEGRNKEVGFHFVNTVLNEGGSDDSLTPNQQRAIDALAEANARKEIIEKEYMRIVKSGENLNTLREPISEFEKINSRLSTTILEHCN